MGLGVFDHEEVGELGELGFGGGAVALGLGFGVFGVRKEELFEHGRFGYGEDVNRSLRGYNCSSRNNIVRLLGSFDFSLIIALRTGLALNDVHLWRPLSLKLFPHIHSFNRPLSGRLDHSLAALSLLLLHLVSLRHLLPHQCALRQLQVVLLLPPLLGLIRHLLNMLHFPHSFRFKLVGRRSEHLHSVFL